MVRNDIGPEENGGVMPKRKRRDPLEKQSQRFVETAKKLGADESGKPFEKAMKAISTKNTSSRK